MSLESAGVHSFLGFRLRWLERFIGRRLDDKALSSALLNFD